VAVPPPQKSNQTLKIILILGGALLVLCCIGAIIAGAFGIKALRDATGPAKSVVTGYYDDLKAGNYGEAYDRICAQTKQQVTREDFIDVQNLLPHITDYKVSNLDVTTVNGKTTGTAQVQVTRERGGTTTQTVRLIKEDGHWKVCEPGP
jgi:Domain of unknown function (DUF4878)